MLMNEILKTKLIRLFSETSQTTNQKLGNAYGDFMEQVKTVSQSENNLLDILRLLNITRVELVFLKSLSRYEQGGKYSEICLH